MEWRERGRIAKLELEEGEGYLYPLPNVAVAVLEGRLSGQKGGRLSAPWIIRPEMGQIIWPYTKKIWRKTPPLHLIDGSPGP
jgi:hypothetical protein